MKIGIDTKQRAARTLKEKGMGVYDLAKKLEVGQSTLWNFLYGKTLNFGKLPQLAVALDVSLDWLLSGNTDAKGEKEIDMPVKVVDRNFQFEGGTIPVLGVANGSTEALVLNFDEPLGKVARHPSQSGMKGAFAFEPRGESMSPRYEAGDMCFAIANKQPAREADCLVELENGEAYLKRFIKRTDKHIICRQFNPPKEWKRPLSEIKAIHAVVGRG